MKLIVDGVCNTAKLLNDAGIDILPELMAAKIEVKLEAGCKPLVVLYCYMDLEIDFEKHGLTVQDANAS